MTPTKTTASPFLLIALLVAQLATCALPAQDDGKKPNDGTPPNRLTEWPKLKATDTDRVLGLFGQFKKPEEKLYEPARQQLIELGEGAMPLLFQQVSDRPENVNPQLFLVFDAVLNEHHASLMAREAQKPHVELRRYLTLRLCRFGAKDLAPYFEKMRKDKDPQTAFYSDLALLAQKHRDALPGVHAFARQNWAEACPLIAEVLPAARSMECGNWVWESIAKASTGDQMTGLRLLRYLAVKEHGLILRGYLDAPDFTVLREAVNTARVMNGEPPVENLPAFKAIEMAKQWKTKL